MIRCQYCGHENNRRTHCPKCHRPIEILPYQQHILQGAGYNVHRREGEDPAWEWYYEQLSPSAIVHSTLQNTAMDAWVLAWHDHCNKEPEPILPPEKDPMTVGQLRAYLESVDIEDDCLIELHINGKHIPIYDAEQDDATRNGALVFEV